MWYINIGLGDHSSNRQETIWSSNNPNPVLVISPIQAVLWFWGKKDQQAKATIFGHKDHKKNQIIDGLLNNMDDFDPYVDLLMIVKYLKSWNLKLVEGSEAGGRKWR